MCLIWNINVKDLPNQAIPVNQEVFHWIDLCKPSPVPVTSCPLRFLRRVRPFFSESSLSRADCLELTTTTKSTTI